MPLVGKTRADTIFAAVAAANPNMDKLDQGQPNGPERQAMIASFETLFGADTTYLVANTVVKPTSLITPPGATVAATGVGVAPGSPLAITAAVAASTNVTGTGTIS